MKTNRFNISLLTLAASVVFTAPVFGDATETAAEGGFPPKVKPLSDYAHLDKKSPFEFDPPVIKTESGPDPFEGVSLAGYAGSGKSLTVYIIAGAKEKKRMTIYGDASPYKKRDESGYRVIALNAAKTLKKTTVILEKDGVQKEIAFEPETLVTKGGGPAAGGPKNIQMVPGPDGKMIPRQMVPRPSNAPAGQNQQTYQAPPPFIPGQSGNQQPQGNQPGASVLNAQQQQQAQAVGTMSNQQLVNHLVAPNGQPAQPSPNVVLPQGAAPGGEQPRVSIPPQRRRVVLPTQQ